MPTIHLASGVCALTFCKLFHHHHYRVFTLRFPCAMPVFTHVGDREGQMRTQGGAEALEAGLVGLSTFSDALAMWAPLSLNPSGCRARPLLWPCPQGLLCPKLTIERLVVGQEQVGFLPKHVDLLSPPARGLSLTL